MLRNALVRNGSIVLFTEDDLGYCPERLHVFYTDDPTNGSMTAEDVDLHFETVPAGAADPFAACAPPLF